MNCIAISMSKSPQHLTLIWVEMNLIALLLLEMVAKQVPGGTYARCTHLIPSGDYQEAITQAYAWIEDSDYEPVFPFSIQVYNVSFKKSDDPESVLDIWGAG